MMGIKIKDIPLDDRPRERLIHIGVENLSNEELLSILLKTGTKNYSAKDLSNQVLSLVSNINQLQELTIKKLVSINGIGLAKACVLCAAIELGKRIKTPTKWLENKKLCNAKEVFDYYKSKLYNKKQEHFYCIYLDNSKRVIKDCLLFIGTINQSIVHPREIFKEAYLFSASSIICIHNHPSNNIYPSIEDIHITKNLKEIGELLGIKVLDHIIIGKDSYYSFLENKDI